MWKYEDNRFQSKSSSSYLSVWLGFSIQHTYSNSNFQTTEVGHHGMLRITYDVEECEGSHDVVCIKGIFVQVEKDGEVEETAIYSDNSLSVWINDELVSSVCTRYFISSYYLIVIDMFAK